jgi:hypothetical protein
MKLKLTAFLICLALMTPVFLPSGVQSQQAMAQTTPTQANPPQAVNQGQPVPQRHYYQSSRERRSYERETRSRRHYRVTKGEVLTLATVAAMPMGIGAIAAGGRVLAIGAVIAGPSTVAAHYIWKHFHRS